MIVLEMVWEHLKHLDYRFLVSWFTSYCKQRVDLLGYLAAVPRGLDVLIPKDSGDPIHTPKNGCATPRVLPKKAVSGGYRSYLHSLVSRGIDVLFREASRGGLLLLENQHQRCEHHISIKMSLLFF